MDDAAHGVRATLIDLGLSRMDAGDGSGGEMVHWTPFEEEIFEGEGDYQFDIYRYMRAYNRGNWEAFNPLTNAMVCSRSFLLATRPDSDTPAYSGCTTSP
jgi:serine/threonine-protein kinase haspin